MSEWITDNPVQILAINETNDQNQHDMKDHSTQIDSVIMILTTLTKSLKDIPSEKELQTHKNTIGDEIAQIQQAKAGLAVAVEEYKFSESGHYNFQRATVLGIPRP